MNRKILKSLLKQPVLALGAILISFSTPLYGQGFYKDIFMDGGITLASRKDLPAARRLGLSIEHFASSKGKKAEDFNLQDTLVQNALFLGDENDSNGVMLYPDGAPRFRLVYVNGGSSMQHGKSLTAQGRENFRTFFFNGGSYVGTCAGMFLAATGNLFRKKGPVENFFQIWPGYTQSSRLTKARPGLVIEKGSRLLHYYDFGGDNYIDSVYHNNGGFLYTPLGIPEGTETLLRYDYLPLVGKSKNISMDGEVASWAWKESEGSGRMVVIGSHPESVTYGERLDLMSALILYALDGVGSAKVKGELLKGERRVMDKSTEDNDPAFTKIGDKQYHHFTFNIPNGAKNVRISLDGRGDYDLNLFLREGSFAFVGDAQYMEIAKGAKKELLIDSLDGGEWYIGVECDTTVETTQEKWGVSYSGNVGVLNGVAYSIVVDWE
ncbi:MAG: hypothetical protein WC960_03025 [Bacteroidales bacterium]